MCQLVWRTACLLVLVAVAQVVRAEGPDLERAKNATAAFIGMDAKKITWLRVFARDGTPNWFNSVVVDIPDPPNAPDADQGTIYIRVEPREYYVATAHWTKAGPTQPLDTQAALSLAQGQALAEAFVRSHFPAWSSRMHLTAALQGDYGGQPGWLFQEFRWEEELDGVRTGTFVRIGVNPRPPGRMASYSAYIAPSIRPDVVKVRKDQAEAAAAALVAQGATNPDIEITSTELFLARPYLEQPHWHVKMRLAEGGMKVPVEAYIDAITGEQLQPQFR